MGWREGKRVRKRGRQGRGWTEGEMREEDFCMCVLERGDREGKGTCVCVCQCMLVYT